jgi:hypothetical protein
MAGVLFEVGIASGAGICKPCYQLLMSKLCNLAVNAGTSSLLVGFAVAVTSTELHNYGTGEQSAAIILFRTSCRMVYLDAASDFMQQG